MEQLRTSFSGARDPRKDAERRTERSTVTTRERIQVTTRNAIKETPNAGNRGGNEKSKSRKLDAVATPPKKKKEKDVLNGEMRFEMVAT